MCIWRDFRQCLHIIPKGTIIDITEASLMQSDIWRNVTCLRLIKNMRLDQTAPDREECEKFLLDFGDGRVPVVNNPDYIQIPLCIQSQGIMSGKVKDLIKEVFPELKSKFRKIHENTKYFVERAIPLPTR